MQVFKLFLNLLNKNKVMVLVYIVIFALVTVLVTSNTSDFSKVEKVDTCIEFEGPEDEELLSFLDNYIDRKPKSDVYTISDSLFWNEYSIYIYVPVDYKDKLFNGEEEIFKMISTPDSIYAYQLITSINEYLNLAKTSEELNLCTKDNALTYAKEQMIEVDSKINVSTLNNDSATQGAVYNIVAYVVSSLILLIMGVITFDLRNNDIQRRLNISPVKAKSRNLILIACYAIFTLLVIVILTAFTFIPLGNAAWNNLGLFFLNNCLYGVVMVFMGYLLSTLCRNQAAFNCISVALPLVTAFLTGSMISQEFMPEITLNIAHILPGYYTVFANDYISTTTSFDFLTYLSYIWPLAIFAALFISLTIFVGRVQAKKES